MMRQRAFLVTFKDGAEVVEAADPQTAEFLVRQMHPERDPYRCYLATADDKRIVNTAVEPVPHRKTELKGDLPFTDSISIRYEK